MAKEIEYTIKPNGEVSIETFGTVGHECTKIVDKVVATIGGVIIDDEKKKEYYDKSPKVFANGGQ